MTCKIQILSIVDLPGQLFREIAVTVSKAGVSIALATGFTIDSNRDTETQTELAWDQAADMELLANMFEFETVAVFRQLVTMLGKAYANRAAYEELL